MPLTRHAIYQRKIRAQQLQERPDEYREECAEHARQWRQRNKEHIRAYMKEYFYAWRSNPVNAYCHRARTLLSSLRYHLRTSGGTARLHARNKRIYQALQDAGWDYSDKSQVLNHIVSIKILVDFCNDLPFDVIYDVDNLEVVSRQENNSVSTRTVNDYIIATAKKLEQKYPEYLNGLTKYVETLRGKTI